MKKLLPFPFVSSKVLNMDNLDSKKIDFAGRLAIDFLQHYRCL